MQKKCFDKPADRVGLYYRADANSEGRDRIVVDVDTRLGRVFRYAIDVDIRSVTGETFKPESAQTVPAEHRVDRTVLRGNETRLATPNYLNADCSSGPRPDVRIVTAPKNGAYRTEETTIAAERSANSGRAACNGKPVNAVAVYYEPTDEFSGGDHMVIDVDFRNGVVRRYIYAITIR